MISEKIFLCGFLIIILSSCVFAGEKAQKKLPEKEFTITTQGGKKIVIKAEIARSEGEKTRGLMFRKSLEDGMGMLFVWERDEVFSFWMKNTLLPLSIAYISSDGTIAELHDMRPGNLSSVQSMRSLRYALEVPQGWFAKEGVSAGDTININEGLKH